MNMVTVGSLTYIDVYIMNADGSNVRNVTHNVNSWLQPCGEQWSPDKSEILFQNCSPSDTGGIWLIKPDGTGLVNLLQGNTNGVVDPKWSPDGTKIAYSDGADLLVIPAAGGTPVTISPTAEYFNWCPNGKIAYEVYSGSTGLYTANADGTSPTFIVDNELYSLGDPYYSPDGSKITYSMRGGVSTSYLISMNSDGSSPTTLFTDTGGFFPMSWSPDGTKIAFVENSVVEVINNDGSNPVQISTNGQEVHWSPDSQYVVFSSSDNKTYYKAKADGSSTVSIYNPPGLTGNFDWVYGH